MRKKTLTSLIFLFLLLAGLVSAQTSADESCRPKRKHGNVPLRWCWQPALDYARNIAWKQWPRHIELHAAAVPCGADGHNSRSRFQHYAKRGNGAVQWHGCDGNCGDRERIESFE